MRTATYLRFSSDKQNEASITDQLRNVTTYTDRAGWPAPRLFKDQAITGSRNDRPGYLEMIKAAEANEFDVLIVDDLSRLARDNLESTKVIRLFKFLGIRIIGVSDGTDTDRDSYKIETGFKGLMNEAYLDNLAKMVHRGQTRQALSGYSTGRPPYGYRNVVNEKGAQREINEDEAQWVRYVYQRFAEGASTSKIAVELNNKGIIGPNGGVWSRASLEPSKGQRAGMLGNLAYIGRYTWNQTKTIKNPLTNKKRHILRDESEWITVERPELRIIDEELWAKVQDRVKQRKAAGPLFVPKKGGRQSTRLFNGLLYCAVCGARIVAKNDTWFGCQNTIAKDSQLCTNRKNIKYAELESILLEGVKKELLSEEAFEAFTQETQRLLAEVKPDKTPVLNQLARAQKELDNLMTAIKAGIITATTKQAVSDAEHRIEEANIELRAIENFKTDEVLPMARASYQDLVRHLGEIENVYLAREAMRKLIGSVTVRPTEKGLVAELERGNLSLALYEMNPMGGRLTHFISPQPLVIQLY